jgi:hypothetical protein
LGGYDWEDLRWRQTVHEIPISKIARVKQNGGALQAQNPEFKHQSHPKKEKRKEF